MTGNHFAPSAENDNSTGTVQNEREMGSTHKSTIYELFVLGELMDGPHHGYSLREILSRMLGPFRHISWGVLYPLIRQLQHDGLIEADEEAGVERSAGTAGSKQRKSYRITGIGRERFYDLMLERGDYNSDYPEYFTIKLNNFDHISPEEQLTILWHYHRYLEILHFYIQGGQQFITNASPLEVPEDQRSHILRTISYRASGVQAELAWIDHEIARVEQEQERATWSAGDSQDS